MLCTTFAYSRDNRESSNNSKVPAPTIPRPPPINSNTLSMGPNGQQVNVYSTYTGEPAPMGIADYGVGQNGAYQYNTSSFTGIISINSLATKTSSNDSSMGIQLNVNLAFTSNGKQYVYWVQNVVCIDTSTNTIDYFENNIWNTSARSAGMSNSGIVGNGQVWKSQYYAVEASSSLPGSSAVLQYPATIILNVTCGINFGGQPTVSFSYNDGYGLETYDTVAFITNYPITTFSGFVVNGYNYNPTGYLFYDSELIIGGPGDGANTQLLQSNVRLQLEYWNGQNYQLLRNAYNFGSDTAEGISNTLSQLYYYSSTGSIFAMIQNGSGSLNKLYDQSTMGIIDIKSILISGTLYVTNATYSNAVPWQIPFINGEVAITIVPGRYNLQLYQNGVLYCQANATVTGGQTISLQTTSVTLVPAGASTAVSGTNYFTVSYTLNGQQQFTSAQNNSLVLIIDSSTSVDVSGISSGSNATEEWTLDSFGPLGYWDALIPAGSNATLYYYDTLSQQVAYTISGSGNPAPPILTYNTAPATPSSQLNTSINATTLSGNSQTIMALRGTTVSITNSILGTSQDQWGTPISTWNVSQANQIPSLLTYYHQYQFTTSYATPDNSTPSSPPLLSGTQFGSSCQMSLTNTLLVIWLDENTQWSISDIVIAPSGTEQWIQTADPSTSGTITQSVITPNLLYFHQYYLLVTSAQSNIATSGSGWYNAESTAYAGLASGTATGGAGTQYVFDSWSTGGINYQQSNTIIMNGTVTAAANWNKQYYLTVNSPYGLSSGSGWYNSGSNAQAALLTNIVSGNSGTQYVFSGWTGDASGSDISSNLISMNSPKIAIATWMTQYQLTLEVNPSGCGSTTPTGGNLWVTAGPLLISTSPNSGYSFLQWTANSGSITFANGNSYSTTANVNGPGIITASMALTPTPTPQPTPTPTPSPTLTPVQHSSSSSTSSSTATPTTSANVSPSPSSTPTVPEFPPTLVITIMLIAVATSLSYEIKRYGKH